MPDNNFVGNKKDFILRQISAMRPCSLQAEQLTESRANDRLENKAALDPAAGLPK